jgi:uncharacterized protein (DUF2336 family)
MIVRHFIQWVRTAPAGERAEATGELARAYLYSDLSPDDLGAAEGAMLMLLDDPSPLVRRALADVLAASPNAPSSIVFALAADQPSIAAPVLALSPLFVDADLVDTVATGGPELQAAIASRATLPCSVSAAIAEVGTAEACLLLLENGDADIAPFSLDRIVERFGHLAAIREPLLARADLPAATRHTLVVKLSQTLAVFVAGRAWLEPDHADRIAREACEKATVAIAADSEGAQMMPLIRHLRASGQLTAGLILRALLSGNLNLFEEALAELADMPIARVSGLVYGSGSAGLRALFVKAGLPASTYPAFKIAIETLREGGFISEPGDAVRLKRRVVERVLTGCECAEVGELAPLLTLLRRFATEAARDEARMFCDELAAGSDAAEQAEVEQDEAAYDEIESAHIDGREADDLESDDGDYEETLTEDQPFEELREDEDQAEDSLAAGYQLENDQAEPDETDDDQAEDYETEENHQTEDEQGEYYDVSEYEVANYEAAQEVAKTEEIADDEIEVSESGVREAEGYATVDYEEEEYDAAA